MELITITILTLITTILFFYLLTQHLQNNKLPPGPWNLPIIGSIHHFINSGSLIHVTLRNMARTHGPLMHLKIGELNTIVASSPESAKAIMKTHDVTFATRPLLAGAKILTYGGKDMIFTPYSNYWRQLRKICILELLSAKRISSFSSIRHEEVHNLIHSLSSSSSSSDITINVSEKIKSCINNITVGASLGSKWMKDEQMMFLNALNEAVDFVAGFGLHDMFPSFSWLLDLVGGYKAKVEACHQKFDCVIDCILQEHRHRRKKATSTSDVSGGEDEVKDLIDVLLKLQEDDSLEFKLTDDCIKAVVLDIVSAGSETSSTVILWAMSELMRNPAAMKTVQKAIRETFKEEPLIIEAKIGEAKYLQSVIKETLRLHAPVPLPRECRETCNVLGYEIPQGTIAIVNVWAIGRDPAYWEDAEQFKPERFEGSALDFKGNSFEFLPFGSGRRMCPGILFGTVNVELVLANLLYYFDWELPGGVQHHELDMTEVFGATNRRMSDLCLCAKVVIPVPE